MANGKALKTGRTPQRRKTDKPQPVLERVVFPMIALRRAKDDDGLVKPFSSANVRISIGARASACEGEDDVYTLIRVTVSLTAFKADDHDDIIVEAEIEAEGYFRHPVGTSPKTVHTFHAESRDALNQMAIRIFGFATLELGNAIVKSGLPPADIDLTPPEIETEVD